MFWKWGKEIASDVDPGTVLHELQTYEQPEVLQKFSPSRNSQPTIKTAYRMSCCQEFGTDSRETDRSEMS